MVVDRLTSGRYYRNSIPTAYIDYMLIKKYTLYYRTSVTLQEEDNTENG